MFRIFLVTGSLFSCAAIVCRALSWHSLRLELTASRTMDQFNLAADYFLIHGLALVVLAHLADVRPCRSFTLGGWALLVGSLCFQGTVIAKCFVDLGPAGALTPVGGVLLMLGWLLLALGGLGRREGES